jgi:hypothetical protein
MDVTQILQLQLSSISSFLSTLNLYQFREKPHTDKYRALRTTRIMSPSVNLLHLRSEVFLPLDFCFTERIHWIGGWVGLKAGLDTEASGVILYLCWGSKPLSVYSQTLFWLSYTSFYSLRDITRIMRLKRMRWVGHVLVGRARDEKLLQILLPKRERITNSATFP